MLKPKPKDNVGVPVQEGHTSMLNLDPARRLARSPYWCRLRRLVLLLPILHSPSVRRIGAGAGSFLLPRAKLQSFYLPCWEVEEPPVA